eukprot:m.183491 g.183491  ORF g.183491 m.183491 type:complete len:189 (+) comp18480_c0_seq5:465-1031(+)
MLIDVFATASSWDEVLQAFDVSNKSSVFNQYDCLVPTPDSIGLLFRPPVDCSFCRNVTNIPTISDLSATEFNQSYAFSGQPIVVANATAGWKALHVFSFPFFQRLYNEVLGRSFQRQTMRNCNFFPYQTSFHTLDQVFAQDAAAMTVGPNNTHKQWYTRSACACDLARCSGGVVAIARARSRRGGVWV